METSKVEAPSPQPPSPVPAEHDLADRDTPVVNDSEDREEDAPDPNEPVEDDRLTSKDESNEEADREVRLQQDDQDGSGLVGHTKDASDSSRFLRAGWLIVRRPLRVNPHAVRAKLQQR